MFLPPLSSSLSLCLSLFVLHPIPDLHNLFPAFRFSCIPRPSRYISHLLTLRSSLCFNLIIYTERNTDTWYFFLVYVIFLLHYASPSNHICHFPSYYFYNLSTSLVCSILSDACTRSHARSDSCVYLFWVRLSRYALVQFGNRRSV